MKLIVPKLLVLLIFTSVILPQSKDVVLTEFPPGGQKDQFVLAEIGDRKIYIDEFYRRAEYAIRPGYCKGKTNVDKMIILNSLIAEKLMAIEAGDKCSLNENESYRRYILGRKEQAMRQKLFEKIAYDKVKIDSNYVWKIFRLAGRKYRLKYFNIEYKDIADSAIIFFRDTSRTFEKTFEFLSGGAELPVKEIDYFTPENKIIIDSLFTRILRKNEVIGAVSVDDSTNLIIKVDGWTDSKILSGEEIKKRFDDIRQRIHEQKADEVYKDFMASVMKGRKIDFYRDTFYKLVNALGPMYLSTEKAKQELFLNGIFTEDIEQPELKQYSDQIEGMINEPLFSVDGNEWTVGELEKYLDVHPFVFRRKKIDKGDFARQFKFAIVDLIRDKLITEYAYRLGLSADEAVTQYAAMFDDAVKSIYQKRKFLIEKNAPDEAPIKVIEKYLNPYVDSLQKKYNDIISINVSLFNKISITSTDMFVTQEGVPFPIVAPAFPQLTTDHHLDYGKKMDDDAQSDK